MTQVELLDFLKSRYSEASLCQIRAHLAQADEKQRDEIARLLEAAEIKSKLANDQISSLNNRISSMLASRSWQITAPLRVLQRWILGR
jgi:hypothetical protein